MTMQAQDGFEGFAAGQLWKTEYGFILITEEGRRLVCNNKFREPNLRAAVVTDSPGGTGCLPPRRSGRGHENGLVRYCENPKWQKIIA